MNISDALSDTIPEAVFAVARRAPERVAMQIKQGPVYRRCTYQQLVKQTEELVAALLRHDLCREDRMAIIAENRPEWLIAYLAIVAAGGKAVPLDIQLSSGELTRLLRRSGSKLALMVATIRPFSPSIRFTIQIAVLLTNG